MKSILLAVQGIRVKQLNSKQSQLLDSFSGKAADLYDILYQILKEHEGNAFDSKDIQQALEVKEVKHRERQIEGLLEGGHYGSGYPIRNLDRWKSIAYTKKIRDVDMNPFYFLFDLPEGKELGFLVLQSTGGEGVQTLFEGMLHEEFVKEFPDDRIRYHRIVPDSVRKELEKAPISEVRLIRHSIPKDLATVVGPKGSKQASGTMSLSMKFEEDGSLASNAARAFFEKGRGTDRVLELEGLEFPYDSVKIKVKLNGKEHTMDLANPDRLRASFDVTEEIERSRTDGQPTFESLSRVAREKLEAIKAVLYGGHHVPGKD
jgi:hypothetical protein